MVHFTATNDIQIQHHCVQGDTVVFLSLLPLSEPSRLWQPPCVLHSAGGHCAMRCQALIAAVYVAHIRHPLCQEVQGNVLDPASLQAACIGCHAVISCVGTNMMSNAPQDREFSAIGASFPATLSQSQCKQNLEVLL
jgi:hypothetical protein